MGHKVVVFDISVVRALWETRVKKHKAWQKKEEERLEKSALEKYVLAASSSSCLGVGSQAGPCAGEGAALLCCFLLSGSSSLGFMTCVLLPGLNASLLQQ